MSDFKDWEDLASQWEESPAESPTELLLSDIIRCPRLLHFRNADEYATVKHSNDLKLRIKRTGAALDPLLVGRAGGRWVILDGHLRWAAYKAAGWTQRVPVRVFIGTAASALFAAIEANSHLRLALTPEERNNAAWRLVRLEEHSKAAIAKATGTGTSTVARMRKQLNAIRAADLEPNDYPVWREARDVLLEDSKQVERFDVDAEREEIKGRISRALGAKKLQQQPELCAEALYEIAGHRARDLARFLADITGLVDMSDLDDAYHEAFEWRPRYFMRYDEETEDF